MTLIFCSALADSPQQTLPFSQTLVCYAFVWTEKPSGTHKTCKCLHANYLQRNIKYVFLCPLYMYVLSKYSVKF